MIFKIIKEETKTRARCATVFTKHGTIDTPEFMPVGTQATVKSVTPAMLKEIGTQIILANTYHLYLKPGSKVIKKAGGLHKFCGWDGPILTDSGGFQIFSLKSTKITEEGALFPSIFDGSSHFITPEDSIRIQEELGSDIMMVLDICPAGTASYMHVADAVEITTKWAKRCASYKKSNNLLFGIIQGGIYEDLRLRSAKEITGIDFDGFAIGGLSVGENKADFHRIMSYTSGLMPQNKPRYLMGVGKPSDIVESVAMGIDLFDCVMPTRNARNGQLFTKGGAISIKNARFTENFNPIETGCNCYCCKNFTLSYLNHLYHTHELLYYTLATIHNLQYMHDLMAEMRNAIKENRFSEFRESFYNSTNQDPNEIYRSGI